MLENEEEHRKKWEEFFFKVDDDSAPKAFWDLVLTVISKNEIRNPSEPGGMSARMLKALRTTRS